MKKLLSEKTRKAVIFFKFYFISCSVSSNSGLSKNSLTEISNPSHIFLMETTPGFWLLVFSILYMVDGATPEMFARALTAMFLSAQRRKIILQKYTINRVGYIALLKEVCYNYDISHKGVYYAFVIHGVFFRTPQD